LFYTIFIHDLVSRRSSITENEEAGEYESTSIKNTST